MPFSNLAGKKFSRLLALEPTQSRKYEGYSRMYWKCRCDCGKEIEVRRDHLIRGNTKSCGCLQLEAMEKTKGARVPVGSSAKYKVLKSYREGAKNRGLSFDLSEDYFYFLVSKPCHYCGKQRTSEAKIKGCYGTFLYTGIDRFDSSRGYSVDNCLPCCKDCNTMKMDLDYESFLDKIRSITKNLGLNQEEVYLAI